MKSMQRPTIIEADMRALSHKQMESYLEEFFLKVP